MQEQFSAVDIARVRSRIITVGECHIWTGYTTALGYGTVGINDSFWKVHRLIWTITNGPIPKGLWVLHSCPGGDNPACCNPAHLRLGTAADNNRDRAERGRSAPTHGERNPAAKLAASDVLNLRTLSRGGVTGKTLARIYGIGESQVSRILRNLSWHPTSPSPDRTAPSAERVSDPA